jgi:hypothetical protein
MTINFVFQLNTCGYSPYVTSSLAIGSVCRSQLLLELASAVILMSESHGTHDHILLSQIRGSPKHGGPGPRINNPRNRVAWLYPTHWVPFHRLLRLAGRPGLHTGFSPQKVKVKVNQFVLATGPFRPTITEFFQLNSCDNSPFVASSLTRRWVCLL